MQIRIFLLILCLATLAHSRAARAQSSPEIKKLMDELRTTGSKLKWNPILWFEEGWQADAKSRGGRPLLYYVCGKPSPNASLIFSAVHGDEITPVYWGFRMVNFLKEHPENCMDKQIVVAPLVNPDGFLKNQPTRTNERGIDLNRNFATKDFSEQALKTWKSNLKSDKRKFPGEQPASEPETVFQQDLIAKFKPGKILSVHAPLNLMDYDGPETADFKLFTEEYLKSCKKLQTAVKKAASFYRFSPYGYFPGSLGNYAGRERGIPTFTLELPSINAREARHYFDILQKGTLAFVNYKVTGNPLQAEGH